MSIVEDFAAFWKAFPRHVGKIAAARAYKKARTMASAQAIVDGVEQYKRAKPGYADWCHPATFLLQGRWMDEPDAQVPSREDWVCPHTPRHTGRNECQIVRDIAAYRKAQGR